MATSESAKKDYKRTSKKLGATNDMPGALLDASKVPNNRAPMKQQGAQPKMAISKLKKSKTAKKVAPSPMGNNAAPAPVPATLMNKKRKTAKKTFAPMDKNQMYKSKKKMTMAEDAAYDKKNGLKEGSKKDNAQDKESGIMDKKAKKAKTAKKMGATSKETKLVGKEMKGGQGAKIKGMPMKAVKGGDTKKEFGMDKADERRSKGQDAQETQGFSNS